MKTKNTNIIKSASANIGRFIVGFVFLFSGFVKAIDPLGFQYKLTDYFEAFGVISWIPDYVSLLLGIGLSVIEFSIGVFLVLGIRRRFSTTSAFILMAFMTPFTLFLAITDPVPDCGCFGDAWIISNWQTFWKNVILLLFSFCTFRWRKAIRPFYSAKTEWMVSIYTILFAITLSFYCIHYLPIIDFRPFKIGINIKDAMRIPDDAKAAVYETYFIMEKDGKKTEFSLENYPDSTWTFVDARTILKEKGFEPSIHDFSLVTHETGEDITDSILDSDSYTFFLVAHRLDDADDSNIDLINEIYDYTIEKGYGFYCLTSSSNKDIDLWKDKTGAEYPFLLVDNIALKTMIRSNPGLVLIKGATILNKWNDSDLPDEYVFKNEKLENIEIGQQKVVNVWKTIGYTCLWFLGPLFLILIFDILFVQRNHLQNHNKQNQDIEVTNMVNQKRK